ncbi:PQQ-binding-like beta-propeller repeat protein [Candidatus Latescibacterota bacterium]
MRKKACVFLTVSFWLIVSSGFVIGQEVRKVLPSGYPGKNVRASIRKKAVIPGAEKESVLEPQFGTQLTFTGIDKWDTDWSPNGQLIVYEDDESIYMFPSMGGNPVNLTENSGESCFYPRFNPLSNKVIFSTSMWNETLSKYIFNIESVNIKDLTRQVFLNNAVYGCWDHDGNNFVYRRFPESDLVVFNWSAKSFKIIEFTNDFYFGRSCFTPDDKFIITSLDSGDGDMKLFMIPSTGGTPTQLTFNEGDHYAPDCSPDGRWILYTTEYTTMVDNEEYYMDELYVYDMETGQSLPVFPGADRWNSNASFNTDGKKFCYLLDVGGISEVFVADFTISPSAVTFPDPNLETAIREALNIPTGPITDEDLMVLTDLDAQKRDISDLTGIEHCVNMSTLNLHVNQISDLSPLSNLINLQWLELSGNQISDISPLSGVINLYWLYLNDNQISDISPLNSLTNLQALELGQNHISEISPLSGLTDLDDLRLSENQIDDLSPLNSLIKLHRLNLYRNQVSDLSSLSGLTDLDDLRLSENQISDLSPLNNLTNLKMLHLGANEISKISPLSSLTNLVDLDLNSNEISNISPLNSLTNLVDLYSHNNQISDLSPLSNLINLNILDLRWNQISDISPLGNLTNPRTLYLDDNLIQDISPLAGMRMIGEFVDLDDWVLEREGVIIHLGLSNNLISDISPLVSNTGIGEGDGIDLRGNTLSSTSLTRLQELQNRGVNILFSEVAGEPEINITSPNGGEEWVPGSLQIITWESSGIGTVKILYRLDDSQSWILITSGRDASKQSYLWRIPNTRSEKCRVIVVDESNEQIFSRTPGYFTISPIIITPDIQITSPKDGDIWEAGSTQTISWSAQGVEKFSILYTADGWNSSYNITSNSENSVIGSRAGTYSYSWVIPDTPSSTCQIQVLDESNADVSSLSGLFTITSGVESEITLLVPFGGLEWIVGTTENIEWESTNVKAVTIEYSHDGGSTWIPVVDNYSLSATTTADSRYKYPWLIPPPASSTAFVRIYDSSNPDVFATHPNPFVIKMSGFEPELKFKYRTDGFIHFSSPAIAEDGTIYIGSEDFNLYAVNPDGTLKWRYDTGAEKGYSPIWASPAIGSDGTIYVGTLSGHLYALDPEGNKKWIYQAEPSIFSSPAISDDGTIYFGTHEGEGKGTFYAIRPNGSLKWEKPIEAEIISSPAIGEDRTIYFGAGNGALYAYGPAGGRKWVRQTYGENMVSSPAIGADGTIYVGTSSDDEKHGYLYAINPNGSVKWYKFLGDMVDSSPAIGPDGTIYIASNFWDNVTYNNKVHALNHSNGEEIWYYLAGGNIVSSPAVGSDGTVYIGSDDWKLYALNPADGQPIWSHDLGGETWSSPTIGNDGTVYIGSQFDDGATICGYLHAIDSMTNAGLADSPWPKFRHDLVNSGRVVFETQVYVRVQSPDGGENLEPGTTYTITWTYSGVDNVSIDFSTDDGSNWTTIIGEIPASDGSYSWTIPDGIDSSGCLVRITDTSNSTVSDISNNTFAVSQQPTVVISAPNGGEKWPQGSTQTIQWSSINVENVKIMFSFDDGANWYEIATDIDATNGSYTWSVLEDVSGSSTESTQCKIQVISAVDSGIMAEGAGVFSITSSNFVNVISPTFGDKLVAKSEYDITWEFSGITNVKIEYSTDNGLTWQEIVASTPAASGTYSWNVPDIQSTQCIIKISDTTNVDNTDKSDTFEIQQPVLKIEHNPVKVAQENDEITFNATVTSNSDIQSVTLHYDVTGSRDFPLENVIILHSVGGNIYSGKLDVGFFTAEGMEYFILARDVDGRKRWAPAGGGGYYSIKARVSDMKSEQTVYHGSEQNAYRMISVPLELTQTSIEDQLSGKLPPGNSGTEWRLFQYPWGSDTPVEYPDIDAFSPGKAFWFITTTDFVLDTPEGTTVSTSEYFLMTLKSGWNDIANPWMFNIAWDDIENPSGAELSVLYTYDGKWSDPKTNPPKILEPWKGYAVKNLENRNVIIKFWPIPPRSTDKTALKKSFERWSLSIIATAGDASDSANHLGVRDGAFLEWDRYDHVEPPPVGKYVSLSFPHHDWSVYPSDYTVDFRPPEREISWDFDVKSNITGETVTIEFLNVENLPEGLDFKVIDRDTSRRVTVQDNTFDFVSGDSIAERHFALFVSDSIESEESGTRPEKFVTAYCYPNPFNPRTTLRYELSMPGKVRIAVFNSVGQKVSSYELGYREMGSHEYIFNADGLTSGLYFYRIDAGYAAVTGKMLYMK